MRIGNDANVTTATTLNTYWKDASTHNIIERGSDGLTAAFSWAGSDSYSTVTIIRGKACKLQNSSGTTITSDERLKKDFIELDAWFDFYNALEPCAFKLKTGNSGRYHIGFKAQQVERALLDSGLTTNDFAGFIKMNHQTDADDPEGEQIYAAAGINDNDEEYGLIYSEFTALNTYMIQRLNNNAVERAAYVDGVLNEHDMRIEKLETELGDAYLEIAALKKRLAA
jgi:hypothetical protein